MDRYLDPKAAYSRSELDACDSYWKAVSTEKTLMNASRKEGRQEGSQEKALEIAKSLKANNVSISIIVNSTGLTEEEINKL